MKNSRALQSATQATSVDYAVVAKRLTDDRLGSYLSASCGDLEAAIRLYDWGVAVASAMYADLARLEIVFRNAVDEALGRLGAERGWRQPWYQQGHLFKGQKAKKVRESIAAAIDRGTPKGKSVPMHGQVISELSFGFWRYLCRPTFATSVWVPAVAAVFPEHPDAPDPHRVRAGVEDRVQRLHFLRNRIAHHEPIHERNLQRDREQLLELVHWICPHCYAWVVANSGSEKVLSARPQ